MEQKLNLSDLPKTLSDFDLYFIPSPPDGSCLIHSIFRGYYMPYICNDPNGKKELVYRLRTTLASRLAEKPPGSDKTNYQHLSRGELEEFGKNVEEYKLENMQKTLSSSACLTHGFLEYLSLAFKKDFYIIDKKLSDVILNFSAGDEDLLIKGRESIVLLYDADKIHYDLIAVRSKSTGEFQTHFTPNHQFIQAINQRIQEIRPSYKPKNIFGTNQ